MHRPASFQSVSRRERAPTITEANRNTLHKYRGGKCHQLTVYSFHPGSANVRVRPAPNVQRSVGRRSVSGCIGVFSEERCQWREERTGQLRRSPVLFAACSNSPNMSDLFFPTMRSTCWLHTRAQRKKTLFKNIDIFFYFNLVFEKAF